ncbi:DUF1753-domain-containing protein [Epithele typhae]|uniref:DUF1753-domain-containing protein n=1 Tax=Epithele typhae TaxID=378194 RepID=UPI002008046F|nr:DUF1753-domain-containing protein [Epithele typhae]KAH9940856.1 DUF1753-domain-containing protein [Epithele typhae]
MKLTLRPEWRLRPLSSFIGFLDIKTGVTVALLFAVLNKVAGVYGLIAVLTGAGGSLAQLSLYVYSVLGLVALIWGLKAIMREDPKQTLYFAHLFFADHMISTAWLVFFAVVWWVYTPHDGKVEANSAAQKEVMNSGPGHNLSEEERVAAAMTIWNQEKGLATAMLVMGWIVKVYFAALLYSYAIHLRKGSIERGRERRGLLHFCPSDEDDDDAEEFYRLPIRTPTSAAAPNTPNGRTGHTPTSSISSFTDFVGAPGRARRGKPGKSNLSISVGTKGESGVEVLFDEDLLNSAGLGGGSKDAKPEDRLPLMSASGPSSSHSRRDSRSRD